MFKEDNCSRLYYCHSISSPTKSIPTGMLDLSTTSFVPRNNSGDDICCSGKFYEMSCGSATAFFVVPRLF